MTPFSANESARISIITWVIILKFYVRRNWQYHQFFSELTFCDLQFTKRTQECIILEQIMKTKTTLAVIRYPHLFEQVITGLHTGKCYKPIAEKETCPKQSNRRIQTHRKHTYCKPGNSHVLYLSCKIGKKMFNTYNQIPIAKLEMLSAKLILHLQRTPPRKHAETWLTKNHLLPSCYSWAQCNNRDGGAYFESGDPQASARDAHFSDWRSL